MQYDMGSTIFTFFGPPGSGKGTLSAQCKEELGFKVLSTGDLCRRHIEQGTELGRRIKSLIDEGALVPDEIISQVVRQWLQENIRDEEKIILDGYPRTKSQVELLKRILEEEELDADWKFVLFDIPREVVVRRLTNRLVCSNRDCQAIYSLTSITPKSPGVCDKCGSSLRKRTDDQVDVVQNRLDSYYNYEREVLKYFSDAGKEVDVLEIDEKSPQDVWDSFKQVVLDDKD